MSDMYNLRRTGILGIEYNHPDGPTARSFLSVTKTPGESECAWLVQIRRLV